MTIQLIRESPAWEIRLDRPERANALSAGLVEDLHGILDDAEIARPDALVLRGNSRHFAAGFDLAGLHDESDGSLAFRFLRIGLLLERLRKAPCLTVAIIEGAAIGAGADLALGCDHRIGTHNAVFGFPGARFGLVLGTARLARLVGTHRAHILITGATVEATEARAVGLLTDLTDRPNSAAVIDAWNATAVGVRTDLLVQARGPDDIDGALAALARSVARPGLRDRIAAYARARETS